jgi:hypothetical protein
MAKSTTPASAEIAKSVILWRSMACIDMAAARRSEKITRTVRAVAVAGVPISSVEIRQDGTIIIIGNAPCRTAVAATPSA